MGTHTKKLRYKLIRTFLPIVFLFVLTLSIFNYNNTRQNLLEGFEETKQLSEQQIRDTISLIDAGYRMLEVRLEHELNTQATYFLEAYEEAHGQLDGIDYEHLKVQSDNTCDFIVIDAGTTIVESTEPRAIGFNFIAFDPQLGETINRIRQGEEVWFEQIRTNVGTGKLSKFAYIPTPDKKVLLEVGYSVDGFDDLIEEMKPQQYIAAMIQENPQVDAIRIFDAYGYQVVDSGENYEPTEESLRIVAKALEQSGVEEQVSNDVTKKYVYVELNSKRERTVANTDRIIEITYTHKLINDKLERLRWISLLVNLLVLLSLSISIRHLTMRITQPFDDLKKATDEIAKGNYDLRVDVKADDEIGALAESFNTMVGDINRSFKENQRQKKALEDYNRNLENVVQERTRELARRNEQLKKKNGELEEAWQRANEATELKSKFLAMISHEIRTPINGIVGMSYLMQRTVLNRQQEDYLIKIKNAANVLLELISDVLDISKLESGKTTLENIGFNLDDLLREVINHVSYNAYEKKIELIIDWGFDGPVYLLGDPLRLKQVISNLLNNAIKFTDHGEVILSIRPARIQKNHVLYEFQIKDTGIGIEPSKLDTLFDPFSQANDSIARKYGGTGLGLSICKHFVTMMGGEIWAQSNLGKGSSFYFTAGFELARPFTYERELGNAFKDMKLMLIEDNRTAAAILKKTVEPELNHVYTASNGTEALLLAEQLIDENVTIDVVLADYYLAGMNGFDTIQHLRQMDTFRECRFFIMINQYDYDQLSNHDINSYTDGVLFKPIMKQDMIQKAKTVTAKEVITESRPIVLKNHLLILDNSHEEIHILLAEDNAVNQQVVKEMLETKQIHVSVVSNGNEVLNALQKKRYDMILMDLQMPELDGFDTTKIIRKMPQYQGLPVVALTAHALKEVKEQSLQAGMNDYLSKPLDDIELLKCVSKWIGVASHIEEIERHEDAYVDELRKSLGAFNIRTPLTNLKGDMGLYTKLLKDFRMTYEKGEHFFEQLLKGYRYDEAVKWIHELKGAAGNLGAENLYLIANDIERHITHKGNMNLSMMDKFGLELKRVLEQIDALPVLEGEEGAVVENIDHAFGLNELLRELRLLLEAGRSDSDQFIAVIRQLLENSEHATMASVLVKQIQNYDYDEALVTVDELEKAL